MSKLSAIYSALDSGSAKSAYKLCQQALSKSPNQPVVRALLALSMSRLDLSKEAIETCNSILTDPAVMSDVGLLETIGFVFRREDRFDLLYSMFLQASSMNGATPEMIRQAFIAAAQNGDFDSLSALALKLFKITGDKKYYAWSGFGLALKGSDDRSISLALAMLEKALVGHADTVVNSNGESRNTTSARISAYLALFKLQLLVKAGKNLDACTLLDSLSSTLVNERDKNLLRNDIEFFSCGVRTIDFQVSEIDAVIFEDSKMGQNFWNDDQLYENFFRFFKTRLESSHSRSDCFVDSAPYMALIRSEDVPCLVDFVSDLLNRVDKKSFPISVVNLVKFIYSLDKSALKIWDLVSLSLEFCESENCFDECSPGKQLLLLTSVLSLESADSLAEAAEGLALLSEGSARFPHCSHFRLIECVAYMHFGLTARGVDRFEALGVKNAQWRNLWWLIHSGIAMGVCSKRTELLENALDFFQRNKRDLLNNIENLIQENVFFKFFDFRRELIDSEKSGVKQFVTLELEIQTILTGVPVPSLSVTDQDFVGIRQEADYSPLLFLAFPAVGSSCTKKFAEKRIEAKGIKSSRVCGFQWNREDSRLQQRYPSTLNHHNNVIGKWIEPQIEESYQYQSDRIRAVRALNAFLQSDFTHSLELVSTPCQGLFHVVSHLVKLFCESKLIQPIQESDIDDIERTFDSLLLLHENGVSLKKVKLFEERQYVSGPLPAFVSVLQKASTEFGKKSVERKIIKRLVHVLKNSVDQFASQVKCKVFTFPETIKAKQSSFLQQLSLDIELERQLVLDSIEQLRSRIFELKL